MQTPHTCDPGGDSNTGPRAIEPKLEELKGKIRHLQQVKRTLEEDLREAQCLRHALQEEQDALCTAAHQLEMTYKEKEESCKVLQYKCEELEFDLKREQQLSSETEDLVQQYTFQIQEMKLKHRKLRMKFEGELQQLMAQHKHLYSVYSPEQLPGEIERLQKVTAQLLKAEELRLSQLNSLEGELKRVVNGQQPVGGAADTTEAHIEQASVPHMA
ncbi:synaptonemal complex central element protein 1 isoform X2 [Brienomyrus brachyistius]|uniref:synaptonemal complex central element protein 1 isoform X2 n=1 Tax=Brienomyrus brachyistius TaxID=42636 RepID=UPI0020B21A41|nr:synaptonemal complex central element protein 1 isoform X2 [Brienomyrus brachyistius]